MEKSEKMKKVEETKKEKKEIAKDKKAENSKRGKSNRAKGQKFEAKVRQDLESMGWCVNKWTNTVDYEKNKVAPAKRKYNPFLKVLSIGTGFPDFICFKRTDGKNYEVIGIEVKGNGYLDQTEKGMCFWLLENKIFSRILIAKKSKQLKEIEYLDFSTMYTRRKGKDETKTIKINSDDKKQQ